VVSTRQKKEGERVCLSSRGVAASRWLNPALLPLPPHRMQHRSVAWPQRALPRHSGAHIGREQGYPHRAARQPAGRLSPRAWPPSPRSPRWVRTPSSQGRRLDPWREPRMSPALSGCRGSLPARGPTGCSVQWIVRFGPDTLGSGSLGLGSLGFGSLGFGSLGLGSLELGSLGPVGRSDRAAHPARRRAWPSRAVAGPR
jgi:hypothetical protein